MIGYLVEGCSCPVPKKLAAHLAVCPDCRRLSDEVAQTWQALGACPRIEIPPTFRSELQQRIRDEGAGSDAFSRWQPQLKWPWLALATSALVLAALGGPLRQTAGRPATPAATADLDRFDNELLIDVEGTLRSLEQGYLPAYDYWPAGDLQAPEADPQEREPSKRLLRQGGILNEGD